MIHFTALEYVKIDIANQWGHGLDKEIWQERINWADTYESKLESLIDEADDKYLYIKAVNALRDAQAGIPTGYIMGLDCTASGLQIMAILAGCKETAKAVNLINTGKREDVYTEIGLEMGVGRAEIKKPLMTVFYGSTRQPEQVFGENTDKLKQFYYALGTKLPGAVDVLGIIQSCWDPMALEYNWTMPDKHHVNMKVFGVIDKKIEVDEMAHKTFTYRASVNMPKMKGRSLCANVVHSIDAYIARELVRRCDKDNVKVATIHDSFWGYPGDMNTIRRHFIAIMVEIARSNILQDILREITGDKSIRIGKDYPPLPNEILNCEYALS